VYLARCVRPGESDRLLAIKRTLPEFARDHDFVTMFTDEASIARGLVHPNICRIYDQGRHDDQLFIVMEFIHGKDMKVVQHRCRERKEVIPHRYAAFTAARIAEALDFAHNKTNEHGELENIVHRDVSPQNILISYDGVPKLIDFGIAKAKSRLAQTQVGVLKGKFAYMSPEQAMGKPIDRRTDLFALGVVLYELVTGKSAFKGSSDFSTLQRITQAEYTPPGEINRDLPPALVGIINKALARDRDARYATGRDMAAHLDAYLATEANPPSAAVLSAFMRKLFRDDYVREVSRIKGFLASAVPRSQGAGPAARDVAASGTHEPAERSDAEEVNDATGIAPSNILPDEAAFASGPRAVGSSATHSAATVRLPTSGVQFAGQSGPRSANARVSGTPPPATAPPLPFEPNDEPTGISTVLPFEIELRARDFDTVRSPTPVQQKTVVLGPSVSARESAVDSWRGDAVDSALTPVASARSGATPAPAKVVTQPAAPSQRNTEREVLAPEARRNKGSGPRASHPKRPGSGPTKAPSNAANRVLIPRRHHGLLTTTELVVLALLLLLGAGVVGGLYVSSQRSSAPALPDITSAPPPSPSGGAP